MIRYIGSGLIVTYHYTVMTVLRAAAKCEEGGKGPPLPPPLLKSLTVSTPLLCLIRQYSSIHRYANDDFTSIYQTPCCPATLRMLFKTANVCSVYHINYPCVLRNIYICILYIVFITIKLIMYDLVIYYI